MNNCQELANLIESNEGNIEQYLIVHHTTSQNPKRHTWEFKIKYLKNIDNDFLIKEEIWTFVIACAYALNGVEGIKKLASFLCQIPIQQIPESFKKIYIEYKPKTPRKGIRGDEVGNSEIDISSGCIELLSERMIHYKPFEKNKNWICFTEMKLLDDIQVTSGNNPIRNQLIRIIEDATCFQRHDSYEFPEKVHVSLVTPELFMREIESRLYGYKFREYKSSDQNDVNSIYSDMNKARMNPRNGSSWRYPNDIIERLNNNLVLHWLTFEEMISNIPDNILKPEIEKLYENIKDLIQNNKVN